MCWYHKYRIVKIWNYTDPGCGDNPYSLVYYKCMKCDKIYTCDLPGTLTMDELLKDEKNI
jgi:hypothetical protein